MRRVEKEGVLLEINQKGSSSTVPSLIFLQASSSWEGIRKGINKSEMDKRVSFVASWGNRTVVKGTHGERRNRWARKRIEVDLVVYVKTSS